MWAEDERGYNIVAQEDMVVEKWTKIIVTVVPYMS
jgi:hypothetical protein